MLLESVKKARYGCRWHDACHQKRPSLGLALRRLPQAFSAGRSTAAGRIQSKRLFVGAFGGHKLQSVGQLLSAQVEPGGPVVRSVGSVVRSYGGI